MLIAAAWWFENLAPHVGPTDHINFFWGFVHGLLIPVNFIYSLWNERVTIYQSPNSGVEYNAGYVIGAYLVFVFLFVRD